MMLGLHLREGSDSPTEFIHSSQAPVLSPDLYALPPCAHLEDALVKCEPI